MLLVASTSCNVAIGPFQDNADASPVTGLTIAQANIRISKNGGVFAQKANAAAASSAEQGWYLIALSTADTNTPGDLVIRASATSCLPVWHRFAVVAANMADVLRGSDILDVNVTQWASATVSSSLLEDADIQRMLKTTIASTSGAAAVAFALTSGVSADDVYNGHALVVYGSGGHPYVSYVQDYVGADKRVTLNATPGLALANGQTVRIFVNTSESAGAGLTSAQVSAIVLGALGDFDVATSAGVSAIVSGAVVQLDITSADKDAIASAVLTKQMTESYAANGAAPTLTEAMLAIHQYLMDFGIAGVNYTVKKLDSTSDAFVVTLDSATEPAAASRT